MPGDYTGDGHVNTADYVTWRKGLGGTYKPADYIFWRSHFGQSLPGSGGASIPEPASNSLLLTALAVLSPLIRRGRSSMF
jgi:hypothetical protein